MDEGALVETYQETIGPLYRYVSSRCGGDRSLAEDVVQETWLRAVEGWATDGRPHHPLAWLKTVARNLLSNYYRRLPALSLDALAAGPDNAWVGRLSMDGDGTEAENGFPWDEPECAALVSWGLARLRPGPARLIEEFHLEGRSVADIAADAGLSERAVEGRLRRARIKLRKQLEKVVGT